MYDVLLVIEINKKDKEIQMQDIITFCDNYNDIMFGEAHVIELETRFIVTLYNAGYSENEEQDEKFRKKYLNNIIYNRHPMLIAEFSKLNLHYGYHVVNFGDMKERCDCYEQKKKFEFKIEIE